MKIFEKIKIEKIEMKFLKNIEMKIFEKITIEKYRNENFWKNKIEKNRY